MAKKNDKPATKKLAKGMFLSDVAMKEISEVLKHYEPAQKIELIEHLQQMFKEVADYFKMKDDAIYGRYAERQQALLKKYGKLFKPFANRRFDNYFDFNRLLSIKDYYSAEEYNHLASNDDLSQQDIDELAFAMRNFLDGELHFLYLDRNPEFETSAIALNGDEPDKEMTEARQLLTIHYLLKAGFNVEARGSNNVSEVARLAHLLLGKKFTSLQNSNIYKRYKKLLSFENPAQLVKDLKYIKTYFEALDLKTVVELINKDLREAEGDNKRDKK